MKRVVLLAAVFALIFSTLAFAEQDAYFSKAQISELIVREFGGNYWVVVLLNTQVNGFDGFYYYEFENLLEAVTFADMFRRGRIRGVYHYEAGSGKTGYWGSSKIAVISRFYCK